MVLLDQWVLRVQSILEILRVHQVPQVQMVQQLQACLGLSKFNIILEVQYGKSPETIIAFSRLFN